MDTQEKKSIPERGLKQRNRAFPLRVRSRYYLYVVAAFTLIGVIGGYAYFYYVGCRTGSCAITSNPYMSMAWGGVLGYLMPDFFVKKDPGKDAGE